MTDKIYNIPAGCAFAEVLAEKFLNEYRGRDLELTDVLFVAESPCRKSFERCFCAFAGDSADPLPQMPLIGDVEEDELFLTGLTKPPLWLPFRRLSVGWNVCCCLPKS